MPASAKYARGSDAWGLCQKCGLRFLLRELLIDDYFPGLRVCESCYDTRQPQEFPVDVTDPAALYRPSPEWQAIPSTLTGYGLNDSIILNWTQTLPQGGPRIDQYDVYRADSSDGIEFNAPMRLVAFPVDYWADFGANSLADLVDAGNPPQPNAGIKSQTLTYDDIGISTVEFFRYTIIARLNGGRQVASNTVEVRTTFWHASDAMHALADQAGGTLIYSVIFTSRPYPVQDIEQLHGIPSAIPSPAYFGHPEQFYAASPDAFGGTLASVIVSYTYWPLVAASEETWHAGVPDALGGSLNSVVVNYTSWPLASSQETWHAGVPDAAGGSLYTALLQYQNWPLIADSQETFHASCDAYTSTLGPP